MCTRAHIDAQLWARVPTLSSYPVARKSLELFLGRGAGGCIRAVKHLQTYRDTIKSMETVSADFAAAFASIATDWEEKPRLWVYSSVRQQLLSTCNDCDRHLLADCSPSGISAQLQKLRCEGCQGAYAEKIKVHKREQWKQRYNRSEYHREARAKLLGSVDFNCVVCGGEFHPQRSTARTCSDKCRKHLARHKADYEGKSAGPIWGGEQDRELNRLDAKLSALLNRSMQAAGSPACVPIFLEMKEVKGQLNKLQAQKKWVMCHGKFANGSPRSNIDA